MTSRALIWLAAFALAAIVPLDAAVSKQHPQAAAKKSARTQAASPSPSKQAKSDRAKRKQAARKGSRRDAAKNSAPKAPEPPAVTLPPELAAVKQAIGLARQGKLTDARSAVQSSEPPAQKLVDWIFLRSADTSARFEHYSAFIRENPGWPGIPMLRRRAEGKLWHDRRNAATIRGFLGDQPTSAKGRLAFARVLMSEGNRTAAEDQVRAAWRSDELSEETETAVLAEFGDLLTRADHGARMDKRIGRKDFGAAMRAAKRLGDDAVSIVKACAASQRNSDEAKKLLDAVASEARGDLGYVLCRVHYLMRSERVAEAAQLILTASPETMSLQDTDEWWRERRTLVRKLLDIDAPKTAYHVARTGASPANSYYRAEFHFMPGWIALRFLDDPSTALSHFAQIDEGFDDPIVLARAAYWRGRALEALGRTAEMRAEYGAAARHSTAYYGQLARARLGLTEEMELRPPPQPADGANAEIVRAAELLYAVGERESALSFVSDLAWWSHDAATVAALAEVAARNNDARAMLLVGKTALAHGLPLDLHAFPDIGVPNYRPIGPELDRSLVYSIVRTESEFNQRDISHAKAVGLMQVTPEAGRDTAKRFGVKYDWDKLVKDPVYNTQMGAGELAALLKDYRGDYIMSFAGYNAGRGRVQQWVRAYGDPRKPDVDPVDWVERIPFAETRNYVQRVMENVQVYRVRFNGSTHALKTDTPMKTAGEEGPAPRTEASALPPR